MNKWKWYQAVSDSIPTIIYKPYPDNQYYAVIYITEWFYTLCIYTSFYCKKIRVKKEASINFEENKIISYMQLIAEDILPDNLYFNKKVTEALRIITTDSMFDIDSDKDLKKM